MGIRNKLLILMLEYLICTGRLGRSLFLEVATCYIYAAEYTPGDLESLV